MEVLEIEGVVAVPVLPDCVIYIIRYAVHYAVAAVSKGNNKAKARVIARSVNQ